MSPSSSSSTYHSDLTTSSLHSITKLPTKPWKKPATPPVQVYWVDSSNFRKVVQELTGAPKLRHGRRLPHLAPPPLNLVKSSLCDQSLVSKSVPNQSFNSVYQEMIPSTNDFNIDDLPIEAMNFFHNNFQSAETSLGLISPTSNWYSSMCSPSSSLLSPGTLATLELNTLL